MPLFVSHVFALYCVSYLCFVQWSKWKGMNLQLNFMKYNCRDTLGQLSILLKMCMFGSLQWRQNNHREELQGEEVCVRRKNAGKKHGGCSSSRINIWHWLSHRSSTAAGK